MSVKVQFLGSGDSFGSGGRFQTCIMVEGPNCRFLIDCGTSSMIAMRAQGVEPNSIDAILLTHFHGDHFGGVPFILIDAMLASKRNRPLTVAGPPGTRERMEEMSEALFPGSHIMTPKFPLEYIEMEVGRPNRVLNLTVTPQPAVHTPETHPTILRVEYAGKTITYTGDTDWTDDLITAAKGADLLIAECYFYEKRIKAHMIYKTLREHLHELGAKRMVLTHMSTDMLRHVDEVPEQCARDGVVIEI